MSAAEDKSPENSALKPSEARDTRIVDDYNAFAPEDGPKAPAKLLHRYSNLSVPGRLGRCPSTDTLSLLSADDFYELRRHRSATLESEDEASDHELPTGWRGSVQRSWIRNKGLVWVVLAQAFGVLMNICTRLLESKEGGGMHPFQILWVRMIFTCVLSMLYMYFTKTPDFPFGAKGVRLILVARGVGGFFGVFGIYYSLQYLPLADATVLTFLAPIISCWVCSKFLHDTFTITEQIGAFVSLTGVVLIAQPASIFSKSTQTSTDNSPADSLPESSNGTASIIIPRAISANAQPTSSQRLGAVGVAMIGVMGASVAYVTIRWIGKRAHPLISVNYLAVWCLIVSTLCLAFIPSISFILPSTLKQWTLFFLIGVGGFVMQFLLTAGLRYEKGSRATNMVYSQMLFALAADKVIWNDTPGPWSLGGSALILGSAVVIAVQKAGVVISKEESSGQRDEEAAMMDGAEGVDYHTEVSEIDHPSSENTRMYSIDPNQTLQESRDRPGRNSGEAEVEKDAK